MVEKCNECDNGFLQVIWWHDVLRFVPVRFVHSRSNVSVVAGGLKELVSPVVGREVLDPVVSNMVGKVVVLGSIFLDQLHILELYGVIILEGHFIVNLSTHCKVKFLSMKYRKFYLVWIIRDVSHSLDFVSDSPVKPSVVVQLAHDMFLCSIQLLHGLLPMFLGSP